MGLETFTYITSLDPDNPLGSDLKSVGDQHLRGVKKAVKDSFSAVSGAVTATHTELNLLDGVTATTTELNYVDGVTSAIQTQIDNLDPLPSQTGHAGKYLTTDATNASWAALDTDANSTTKPFYEHHSVCSVNATISASYNAVTCGPITINSGISITVPSSSTWCIL
jgi:hypothetical protein